MRQWLRCFFSVLCVATSVMAIIAAIEMHQDGRNYPSVAFAGGGVVALVASASLLYATTKPRN